MLLCNHGFNDILGFPDSVKYKMNKTVRNERFCIYCNLHYEEDEYHLILIGPCYIHIRKIYKKILLGLY
jgi:hypothetical protein